MQDAVTQNLQRVRAGTLLARWEPGEKGASGMDVFGQMRPAPKHPDLQAEDFIGEGVELNRDREGNLLLRASCDGLCQQQSSGAIRVVEAEEIQGDVTPGKPIESSGLVVVRGDVKQGSSVKAAGDIVICGNLEDATIETGGDLKVNGLLTLVKIALLLAGLWQQTPFPYDPVKMAGSLHICGTVRHCELVTTGDIEVEEVIGGRLEAGTDLST